MRQGTKLSLLFRKNCIVLQKVQRGADKLGSTHQTGEFMRLACLGLIFVSHISCDNSGTTFSANTVAIHPAESQGEDALAEQNGAIRPYESSDQDAMEAQVLPPADRSDASSSPAG